MKKYMVDELRDFEVIQDFGPDEDFFRLKIPGVGEHRLPKFKFQRNRPLPKTLRCRIRYVNNGVPVPSHNIPQYVNELYSAGYSAGKDFQFRVTEMPVRASDPFVVEDDYGIKYRLFDSGSGLELGQTVRCRFVKLSPRFFSLQRADGEMRLPFVSFDDVVSRLNVRPVVRWYLKRAMEVPSDIDEALDEYRQGNPRWIVTALTKISRMLSEWFIRMRPRRHHTALKVLLEIYRDAALYLLEDSRFLRNLYDGHRRMLQRTLTRLVESVEPYLTAVDIMHRGTEESFIEGLMSKLRESGYLYHPGQQFSVLMLIFRQSPALVSKYLGQIFDIIMEWKLETWTTEPFRSAFVEQFEIYIRNARREIDLLPQAETQADNDRLEKIITAIALQLFIAGGIGNDDYRVNRSLFYRYISLLRPAKSDDLLEKAFLTLMGMKMPGYFTYDTIKEPMMLMTRATVMPESPARELRTSHSFQSGDIYVTVDGAGISLRRIDENCETSVIPSGMMPWLKPQVYLEGITPMSGSKIGKLDAHRELWRQVETALFEKRLPVTAEPKERREAMVGDDVYIVVREIEDDFSSAGNPMFLCRIDDPEFIAADGVLMREEIVGYKINTVARDTFTDENGAPYHFNATVIGVNDKGEYEFSLKDEVQAAAGEILNYNDTFTAVIAGQMGHEYSAISNVGVGVLLRREPGAPAYPPRTVVRFRVYEKSDPSRIRATIVDRCSQEETIDKMTAFRNIMHSIGGTLEDEEPKSEKTYVSDDDEPLTAVEISEIVELMRFKAIAASEILQAYDYLMYARLLALVTGDEELAIRLDIQAALLRLHQFYATNSRVDADELEIYRDKVSGFPLLEIMFKRLEIVSWLGNSGRTEELWTATNIARNKLEVTLARLVLSFNMLALSGEGDSDAAKGIKNKIAALLGVNSESKRLKYYGSETQYVEFKSSLVFPARKRGDEKIEPNPEQQQFVLLKIIAGFLNSTGGTLYIGVNDQHYEAGFHDDFDYYKRRKATIGTYKYDMKSVDNFCVFLENLVRLTFDVNVARLVEIAPDGDSEKDVIVVKVQPSLTPVFLDGELFERQSTSTVHLTGNRRTDFIEMRKAIEVQRRAEIGLSDDKPVAEEPASSSAEAKSSRSSGVGRQSVGAAKVAGQVGGIATSSWRRNVLHDYDEGYVTPAGYIYFVADNSIIFSKSDLYIDHQPDCRLALVIGDNERDGYLLLAYEGEKAVKVPLSEIYEKGENRPFGHYKDAAIVFATVASEDDALLSINIDNNAGLWQRVTPMADIETAHVNSLPHKYSDAPGVAGTDCYELVAAGRKASFRGSMKSDLGPRQIGYTMHCRRGTDEADYKIRQAVEAAAQSSK